MPLRTVEDYKASLRDGRTVYYRGQRVPDVTTHPVLGVAVEHAAIDFALGEDGDLAVCKDAATGQEYSRYFKLPQNSQDLLDRSRLIEETTRRGKTLVTLVKEIGTDCLFALHMVADHMDKSLGTQYLPKVRTFYEYCRDHDLAMSVAQTDVKGDRGKGAADQEHPDYYVRIVEERPDGIVVRGAKVHTSVTPNANELFVIPTRQLTEADKDYAVAFAIPVNTPGLKLICSGYGGEPGSAFDRPISAEHRMMETLTVFDDVFVPNDRIFLKGEWQYAGPLARTFVEFHRFTAVSYKLPLVDVFVGAAHLMADLNGIERASHVREKLTWLITYAETLRSLTRMAALDCIMQPPGFAVPHTRTVNMAKLHFADNYHRALQHVQDLTGGLLVTGPSEADWANHETRMYLERYLGAKTGVSAADRLRAINMVSDLTTGDFGGYQAVLAIHAEGSIEAEKITILREYDAAAAKDFAKWVAGIQ
jgi:4-hydroxybutyryl-CoA dehydratase/vinylacetyl-CoA-Delta-isomerase